MAKKLKLLSEKLTADLSRKIIGDIFIDESLCTAYAEDESIFKIQPTAVMFPKVTEDLFFAIEFAMKEGISLIARGAGTSVAGQAIGEGIVVDFSRYMNQILDISEEQCRVQPGVTLSVLNQALAKQRRFFAPDPGSWEKCTLGGMYATNAAGPHAMHYGSTRDHISAVSGVLGTSAQFSTVGAKKDDALKDIEALVAHNRALIQQGTLEVEKNSSGYALTELLSQEPSWARFLCGTEGTLAMLTELQLNTVLLPPKNTFAIFKFSSWDELIEALIHLHESDASAIELIDEHISEAFQHSRMTEELNLRDILYPGKLYLWVEWQKDSVELRSILDAACFYTSEPETIKKCWHLRSQASKILHENAQFMGRKPLRCIEDCSLPLASLQDFIFKVKIILKEHDCEGPVFGHIGSGHLHINPWILIDGPSPLNDRVYKLMQEVYSLCLSLNGSLSGEHGDGILRSSFLEGAWKDVYPIMVEIKQKLDPKDILNQGKKISPSARMFTGLPPIKFDHPRYVR